MQEGASNRYSLMFDDTVNCYMMIVDIGCSLLIPCTPWQSSSPFTLTSVYCSLSSAFVLPGSAALCSLLLPLLAALSSSVALPAHYSSLFTPPTNVCCSLHIPCTLWQCNSPFTPPTSICCSLLIPCTFW